MSCRKRSSKEEVAFDLDLTNYTAEELYALFKLNINDVLDDLQLKKARRSVLLSHPDKSGLPPEYFHFFTQAYRMLEQIAVINKKATSEKHNSRDLDNYREEVHQTMTRNYQNQLSSGRTKEEIDAEFRENFNREFEKINQDILPQNTGGYESWLRANDPHIPLEEHKQYFSQKKKEISERERYALSQYGIRDARVETSSSMTASQLAEEPEEYSSGLFSSLCYTDLKKTYSEQFIPVTEEDYHSKRKYNNVDELIQERGLQTTPLTKAQSEQILNDRSNKDAAQSIHRAYELANQYEKAKIKNTQFSKQFFKISN